MNYDFITSTPFILTSIIVILFLFMIFVVCTYICFKILQTSIEYNNVFFYQYNKKCQKLIDQYGDLKINKVYLVRQPFDKLTSLLFNIITLFHYGKYIEQSLENYPYHPAIIFELTNQDDLKFLLVEKNNCINISETFVINKNYDYKRVNIAKHKYTLREVLSTTKTRIGDKKYFNWDMHKNNCQEFTKEILVTLNKNTNKYNEFIFRNKLLQIYSPSDFTLHIINCLFIIRNFIEKYIFDNNIFY
jgi:hypothetical protein